MDCVTKGSLVLRKVQGEPKGVMVVVQPLSNLMNEKMRGSIGRVAVLSMGQELTVVEEGEGRDRAVLSCSIDELLSGSVSVLIGHPVKDCEKSDCCQNKVDCSSESWF